MKKQNKIFNQYMNLLVQVVKYTNSRKSNKITTKDIFIALSHLFSQDKAIYNYFLGFWLDLKQILKDLARDYDFSNLSFLSIWIQNFTLDSRVIKLLEDLEDIKDLDLFSLSLFLELLYEPDIISELVTTNYFPIIQNLNVKEVIDKAYNDKNLKSKFISIIDINKALKKEVLENQIFAKDDFSDFDLDEDELETEDSVKEDEKSSKKDKLLIDTFGTNLTELARKWKLEPVVGREKELNQVIYTLLRKTKSNPLLIGEAWVGKTAIVEWLAQKIVNGDVPAKLKNKQIYMLDMWTLVAGTKFRWEFEARLKWIINEAIDPENNIILFIDEIHTVIWAGNQEWGADTANLLKPYLARGELTLIGATTFDEYKKYIEKDPALTRRFQIVKVDEPKEEEAVELLEWIKHRFEDFHGVNISWNAIKSAVRLSKRYILDKYLPDKAIDLIDEACSRKSSKSISKATLKEIDRLNKKIEKLEEKIKKAVEEQDYFTAADLKEEVQELKYKINQLQSASSTPKELREDVTEQDIQQVIAEKYGISSSVLSKSEIEFLKRLKYTLNKEIIWQEQAVEEVVNAIIRNKLSPVEKNKPIGSFLFLGPSGVGKTYLAQLLAKHFFQDEKALIKINMSEYSQDMSANKLTGSAPGYVGYEEGGQLTEAVRKKPYSVVLFDEIEKWSPQVLNILLQILDQGYLEDNKWRKIDFKNTIVILTSNLWAEYFTKAVTRAWFAPVKEEISWTIPEEKKEAIMQDVKNLLPVELINRFDKIVFFNPVNKDLLEKILKKYYKDYKNLWKEKKWVNIPNLKKDEIEKIVDKVYKEWAGVRGIEKYIYNDLENKIIEKML